ncbi:LamB/YcsF family [Aureococcus anophagefferens]|nr:LamB/YcsF family [Aureococcus anophagefferens]
MTGGAARARRVRRRPAVLARRSLSTSVKRINLNADLAEGYGPWTMTADAELMDIVTSANVACGGHAGDENIMVAACALAAARGVSVGSHPGYADKPGFGRRVIPMALDEIETLVASQTARCSASRASRGRAATTSP